MERSDVLRNVRDRRLGCDPVGALEFIDLQWLLDHHEAKIQYRWKMVDALGLRPGDTVLDVGCGPGLWSELIAKKVWPSGRVVGLDLSAKLIGHARCRQRESRYGDIMEFHEADFYHLPFANERFSATFFGNCFSYVTDPDRVLSEQKRVVRSGGRIAVKDFDGALILFHPVDGALSYRVLGATEQALRECPPDPPFDNYTGRKLPVIMKQSGLLSIATKSYAIQFVPPLSRAAKRYIAGNAQWYGETARPLLSQTEFDAWIECFDTGSKRCILDRDDFYFCMVEVLCIGAVE